MAMRPRQKLKTAFKKARCISPLHTSGPVAATSNGTRIVTCIADEILLTDFASGLEICRFLGDTTDITSLCITPSDSHLLVFTTSKALRTYQISDGVESVSKIVQPSRVVAKAHDAPVYVSKCDPTSTYLASGSADGVVKVWEIRKGYTTHVFRGHGGVVSALVFNYPRDDAVFVNHARKMQLITASVDTRVRIFDLTAGPSGQPAGQKPQAVLEGHISVPRGLDVSQDGKWLISGGRDSVVLIWELVPTAKPDSKPQSKGKATNPILVKTIPISERVEVLGLLHADASVPGSSKSPSDLHFYTGGDKGVIKIWDGREGVVISTLGEETETSPDLEENQRQISDAIYIPATASIISVHADQNILIHSLTTKKLIRQLVGFNDEIVDSIFLSRVSVQTALSEGEAVADAYLAVATNSSLIRIYSTTGLDTRLLSGHAGIVLCLDRCADGLVLASGSKDRSARVWAPPVQDSDLSWGCIALCEGHAESIGAIAMSRAKNGSNERAKFMFTGSQDRTIKMWDLSNIPSFYSGEVPIKCKSLLTQKAHEKDINSLDVSPNNRMLASGSQDRTIKIFEIDLHTGPSGTRVALRLIGTCTGHKRGVWSVRFSYAEKVLATGSGDKTIKLWDLQTFTCVKTFEGHTNSVLRVDFISSGLQMVSSASDGLVKIWDVKDEVCVATMDNHEDKVWALAISSDERTIVSGAADSVLTFWEDCTEEQAEEQEAHRADLVLKEQAFSNYVSLGEYRRAIELALAMGQPGRLLNMFTQVRSTKSEGSITGAHSVDEVIQTLPSEDLCRLLGYIRVWNSRAKTSAVAQTVLHAVLKLRPSSDISIAFSMQDGESHALKEMVDALVPYTERHLARLDRLVQESFVVDFILHEMDDGMLEDTDTIIEIDVK